MTRAGIEKFATIDFEASSLSAASWPIEVGLSWIEGGLVNTWSSLIRPAIDWDLDDWSAQSAEVHGIACPDLESAPEAIVVADRFMKTLAGRIPVSDAPEFDARWLKRLLDTLKHRPYIAVENYDAVSFAHFDGLALDMLYEKLARLPAPHRGGPDSARLAAAWAKALEYQR